MYQLLLSNTTPCTEMNRSMVKSNLNVGYRLKNWVKIGRMSHVMKILYRWVFVL